MTDRLQFNQFFLVLLVIGSVVTNIYVMVLMCLVGWHGGNIHLLAVNAFFICCKSCPRKRVLELWN